MNFVNELYFCLRNLLITFKIKSKMNTYKVTYSGNSFKFRNFERFVNAETEREAVEDVYAQIMSDNFFPQRDGSIKDCDGHTIAEADDDVIEYDGGYFSADLEDEDA